MSSHFDKLILKGTLQAQELRAKNITNNGDMYLINNGGSIKWRDKYGRETGKIYDDGNLNIVTNDNLFISAPAYINTSTAKYDIINPDNTTQNLRFSK
jgi:hypothetical protein